MKTWRTKHGNRVKYDGDGTLLGWTDETKATPKARRTTPRRARSTAKAASSETKAGTETEPA